MYAWEVYRARVQGLFVWTYMGIRDAWDGRVWDGGMVFPGNDTVVTSRRWELLRMGMQDWLLLNAAEKAGNIELVKQAVAEVLAHPDDGGLLRQWRDQVIAGGAVVQSADWSRHEPTSPRRWPDERPTPGRAAGGA